jgi:arylsulfatase A-like enzyme
MRRRSFLQTTMAATAMAGFAAPAAKKPNIILFYVDDLGWMDIACHGSKFYETPNIDRLAKEGVRYTQGYTAHPRCLPARYGVITGRFPARGGVPGGKGHLQPDDTTMAHALSDGGYKTCFVGKWHLTGPYGEKNLPENQGFHVNIAAGAAGAPPTYFYPYRKKPIEKLKKGWELGLDKSAIRGLEKDGKEGDYITDVITTKSIEFVEANKDNPFFLYLSHYGVHTPFEAPENLVKKYEKKLKDMEFEGPEYMPVEVTGVGDELRHQNNAVYAAMIETVDNSLGRIFETLEKLGLADDTIIAFTADNGGLSNRGATNGKVSGRPLATSNLPLRTGKGWLYEGGIREAFIVKWPGVTKPGFVNETDVVVGTDLFPTFLDMAGLPLQPQHHKDGISIVPSLKGMKFERGPVFWHSPTSRPYSTGDTDSSAVRIGNYKLLEWYNADHVELYDLSKDIGEQNDLSNKMPEKTAEMLAVLQDWRKEINAHTREQKWNGKVGK